MLRTLFQEPPRENEGPLRDILTLADELAAKNAAIGTAQPQRLQAWLRSIATTYDELEQSVYCAERFAESVSREYVEEMGPEERAAYRRHLYFYKNSFIRVFSVLDKLGSFLNERFELRAELVKERYSYFTALRCLRESRLHPELSRRLHDIKNRYRDPVHELRLMRNHEVHAMNTELLDEEGRLRIRPRDGKVQVEDLTQNLETLRSGYEMATESLLAVLTYCSKA